MTEMIKLTNIATLEFIKNTVKAFSVALKITFTRDIKVSIIKNIEVE